MRLLSTLLASPLLSLLAATATATASSPSPLLLRDDELIIDVVRPVNCTRKTKARDTIKVNYRGTLRDGGHEFDSSYKREVPFQFDLGMRQVIRGWDMGLLDMCIGEARKLTIPPKLGYGAQGAGREIPPNAWLVFDTELVAIKGVDPPAPDNLENMPIAVDDKESAGSPDKPVVNAAEKGGKHQDGKCHLLGPFAILVQGALGILALLSLVFKRWRESPRRPLKVWGFDVSKQVFGSVLLHIANLFLSMLSSGEFDIKAKTTAVVASQEPNPCSFYLLNLAIDTTIGIPVLVILLRLLHHAFALTPLARPPQSIQSPGH